MKKSYDWETIQRYCNENQSLTDCIHRFGMSRLALRKAVLRNDLHVASNFFDDRRVRYDWNVIRDYYNGGKSMRECAKRFGFAIAAWWKAVDRGDIQPRPNGVPIEKLLSSVNISKRRLKTRLLNAGLLQDRCGVCGLSEWRNRRLTLHLYYLNGIQTDHRLENLQLLCPNCRAQKVPLGS